MKNDGVKSPILLFETSFTLSKILVVVVLALTVAFSLLAGCDWLGIVLRAGSVTLTLGFILYGVNWLISDGIMNVIIKQVDAIQPEESDPSTREWKV